MLKFWYEEMVKNVEFVGKQFEGIVLFDEYLLVDVQKDDGDWMLLFLIIVVCELCVGCFQWLGCICVEGL